MGCQDEFHAALAHGLQHRQNIAAGDPESMGDPCVFQRFDNQIGVIHVDSISHGKLLTRTPADKTASVPKLAH